MKKKYLQNNLPKLLPAFFVLTITLIISGCTDYPVAPSAGKINGRVLDLSGFPYIRVEICTGIYPVTEPDGFGNFSLDAKTMPYDLELNCYYYSDNIYIKALSTFSPQVVIPLENFESYASCDLQVKYPSIQSNQKAICGFISSENFTQKTYQWSDTISSLHLHIPLYKTTITGKIILLVCTMDNTEPDKISSYNNYGEKSVTLHRGRDNEVRFSDSEITYNPPESVIDFSPIIPDSIGIRDISTDVFINFPEYTPYSTLNIFHTEYIGGRIIIPVPLTLLTNFNLKVQNFIKLPHGSKFSDQMKCVYASPGTSVTVDNSEKIYLSSPQNGKTGINENILFNFSGDHIQKGIYIIEISGRYNNVFVVTEFSSFRLADISSRIFHLIQNETYRWQVQKISEFNSLEEFVSKPYIESESYSSISLSPIWYFQAAP